MAPVKRKRVSYKRKRNLKYGLGRKIAKIAKTVALRQQETKHTTRSLGVFQMYHNVSQRVTDNLVWTSQGTNDTSNRIGDEITLRGIKLYLEMEDKWDRPNVTYCIWVAKCRQGIASLSSVPVRAITNMLPLDPMDTERVQKVLVNKKFRFSHKDTLIDVGGEGVDSLNRVTTHFAKIWIPFKNIKYKYQDNHTSEGTSYNIAMWIAAYGASGDLITDNIGRIRVSSEMFFKDG